MDKCRHYILYFGFFVISQDVTKALVYPYSACFDAPVAEGRALTCECQASAASSGTPEALQQAVFSWPVRSLGPILVLATTTRAMNGSSFTCRAQAAGQADADVSYTLQVAYGPIDQDTALTGPTSFVADGATRKMTLTCTVANVHPPPGISWTFVTCDASSPSGSCTFTPTANQDGKMAVCTATNPVLSASGALVQSRANFTIQLQYPPPFLPQIKSTTSTGEVLRTGDTVTCTVAGGKPLVSAVTFHCQTPALPDRYDVIGPAAVSSSVIVDTSRATADRMTCTCGATWGPEAGLYGNASVATFLLEYKATIATFTLNATSELTVAESARVAVLFRCDVIARSSAAVSVHRQGNATTLGVATETAEGGSDVIRRKVHVYSVTSARCEDMATYTCSADSGFLEPVTASVRLYVRCAPRPHNSSFSPPPTLTSQPLTLFLVANPAPVYVTVRPVQIVTVPASPDYDYSAVLAVLCTPDPWLAHVTACSVTRGDKGGDSNLFGTYNVTVQNADGEFSFFVGLGEPEASPFLGGLTASSVTLMVCLIALGASIVVIVIIGVVSYKKRKRAVECQRMTHNVAPEQDPSLPFVEVRGEAGDAAFVSPGNLAVVVPLPNDLYYEGDSGGSWKIIETERRIKRSHSLSSLDPDPRATPHRNPIFQDDESVTTSTLPLHTEVSMTEEDQDRDLRHAKSLQNLFRDDDTITHFWRYPSGQYAWEKKAGRFVTKVALPSDRRATGLSRESAADGVDPASDDASSDRYVDPYAQVLKNKGEGRIERSKCGSYDVTDRTNGKDQDMTLPLDVDTEEEQTVSTDLDEESSASDNSCRKIVKAERSSSSKERRVRKGSRKKTTSSLRKKRGRGGSLSERSRDKKEALKQQDPKTAGNDPTKDISWNASGEAQTSTAKSASRNAKGQSNEHENPPAGAPDHRYSCRLSNEETLAIRALKQEVLGPLDEAGPPAYQAKATGEPRKTEGLDRGSSSRVTEARVAGDVANNAVPNRPVTRIVQAQARVADHASKAEEKSLKSRYGIEDRRYVRLATPTVVARTGGNSGTLPLVSKNPTSHVTQPDRLGANGAARVPLALSSSAADTALTSQTSGSEEWTVQKAVHGSVTKTGQHNEGLAKEIAQAGSARTEEEVSVPAEDECSELNVYL